MGSRHNDAPMWRGGLAVEEIASLRKEPQEWGDVDAFWLVEHPTGCSLPCALCTLFMAEMSNPSQKVGAARGSGHLLDVDEQMVTSAL